jgi:hypothetical protein
MYRLMLHSLLYTRYILPWVLDFSFTYPFEAVLESIVYMSPIFILFPTFYTTQANLAFPALAHHIDSLLGEPTRPVVVLNDFNHTDAHTLLHNIMVGLLDALPLLCNGEMTFPRTNTGPDNIFASPSLDMAANATTLDIQQGDHHPVVATFKQLFPTAAPHGHLADDADQPLHIRWWRLRRPTDKFD